MSSNRRLQPSHRRLIALMEENRDILNTEDNETTRKGLENLCDLILTTVHRDNGLRDAIVDTCYNAETGSLLLVINPSLTKKALLNLAEVLGSMDEIERMSYSSRKGQDGTTARIVKVQGAAPEVSEEDEESLKIRRF